MGSSFAENPSGLQVQSNHLRGKNARVLNIFHSLSSYLLETWAWEYGWVTEERQVDSQGRLGLRCN